MTDRLRWKLAISFASGFASATLTYLALRRRRGRPPHPLPETSTADARALEEVQHRLGVIRGCCEVAHLRGESGDALARRLQTAIDTVGEVSFLVRGLAEKR